MGTSGFSFGPLGAMTDLVVAPAVQVENGRELKSTVTSRGVRWVQRARRNPRTWTVSRPWRDPAWARMLSLAAHGVGGDMWLYDSACAQQNMLPAHAAVGTGTPVNVAVGDGVTVPMGAVTWSATQVGVIGGREYTVSGQASGTGTRTLVGTWRDTAGVSLGTVTLTGATSRAEVSAVAPATAATLTLDRAGTWTAVRVHDGPPDGAFHLTEGTPCRVAVADPQRTYQMVTDERTAIDYEITMMEVG